MGCAAPIHHCSLSVSIEIMKSVARARERAEAITLSHVQFNALNVITTKPSPAAEVESRRCNPMMQNPASRIQNLRPGYYKLQLPYSILP
jgi:hypothetical protein